MSKGVEAKIILPIMQEAQIKLKILFLGRRRPNKRQYEVEIDGCRNVVVAGVGRK
jgi:hypothetical protein